MHHQLILIIRAHATKFQAAYSPNKTQITNHRPQINLITPTFQDCFAVHQGETIFLVFPNASQEEAKGYFERHIQCTHVLMVDA